MRMLVVLGLIAGGLLAWALYQDHSDLTDPQVYVRECLQSEVGVAVDANRLQPEEPDFDEVGDVPDSVKYPNAQGKPGVYLRGSLKNNCDRDLQNVIYSVSWGFVPWSDMDENEAPLSALQELDIGEVAANSEHSVNSWFRALPVQQFKGKDYAVPDHFEVHGKAVPVRVLFAPETGP